VSRQRGIYEYIDENLGHRTGSRRRAPIAFAERFPLIVTVMRAVVEQVRFTADAPGAAVDLYRHLPHIDFSRQILQNSESALRVLRVEGCGWSAPSRIAA
jgi:hypothetical protein